MNMINWISKTDRQRERYSDTDRQALQREEETVQARGLGGVGEGWWSAEVTTFSLIMEVKTAECVHRWIQPR